MTTTTSNPSGGPALPDYAPAPPSTLAPTLNEVRGGGARPRIAVILGSTRPGRLGGQVARWVGGPGPMPSSFSTSRLAASRRTSR